MIGWIPMGTVGGQLQRWQVMMGQGNTANRNSPNSCLSVPVLGSQKAPNENDFWKLEAPLHLAKYLTIKRID